MKLNKLWAFRFVMLLLMAAGGFFAFELGSFTSHLNIGSLLLFIIGFLSVFISAFFIELLLSPYEKVFHFKPQVSVGFAYFIFFLFLLGFELKRIEKESPMYLIIIILFAISLLGFAYQTLSGIELKSERQN